MINAIIKAYLHRFDGQLHEIKFNSPKLQNKIRQKVLNAALSKFYFEEMGDKDELTHQEFCEKYKLTSHVDYIDKIERLKNQDSAIRVPYFAQSSGTGGQKKQQPITEKFVRKNLLRGNWFVLNTLYRHRNEMSVFRFKNLLVGGAIYEEKDNYVLGDISGIMLSRIPWYMRPFYVPKVSTATLPKWEQKIDKTARAAAKASDISMLGGTPTWVLATLRLALQYAGKTKASDLWPNLQAYIYGGVHFEPYRSQFEDLIQIKDFTYLEVYNATEGFFAFNDDLKQPGMLLMTDNEIYYEFIPLDQFSEGKHRSFSIGDTDVGIDYVLVISSTNGLLRYVMGDVIRFTSKAPYRITVIGRINEYINAFGEDLTLDQVMTALSHVNQKHNVTLTNFTVAPRYLTIKDRGSHDWFIEFENQPINLVRYTKDLDHYLQEQNSNYAQKRSDNLAMEELKITILEKGFFQALLKGKDRLGGQSKIQKLRNDRYLADEIVEFLKQNQSQYSVKEFL